MQEFFRNCVFTPPCGNVEFMEPHRGILAPLYTSSIYELEVMMLVSVNAKVLNRLYQSSEALASLIFIFVVQIQHNYAFNQGYCSMFF